MFCDLACYRAGMFMSVGWYFGVQVGLGLGFFVVGWLLVWFRFYFSAKDCFRLW